MLLRWSPAAQRAFQAFSSLFTVLTKSPMMSYSLLLISNHWGVLYPLHPFFLSRHGQNELLTGSPKWITQHCTFPVQDKKIKRSRRFWAKRCIAPQLIFVSPWDMAVIWGMSSSEFPHPNPTLIQMELWKNKTKLKSYNSMKECIHPPVLLSVLD